MVLVTGWGQTISAAECEANSVAGILAKPFTMEELADAVTTPALQAALAA